MAMIQPLHGFTFALLHLACMRLLSVSVPAALAATAQALYGTVGVGLASVVLTLLSGWAYGRFGARGFWIMAAHLRARVAGNLEPVAKRCARPPTVTLPCG